MKNDYTGSILSAIGILGLLVISLLANTLTISIDCICIDIANMYYVHMFNWLSCVGHFPSSLL